MVPTCVPRCVSEVGEGLCWARGLCCAPLSGRAGKCRSQGSVSPGGTGCWFPHRNKRTRRVISWARCAADTRALLVLLLPCSGWVLLGSSWSWFSLPLEKGCSLHPALCGAGGCWLQGPCTRRRPGGTTGQEELRSKQQQRACARVQGEVCWWPTPAPWPFCLMLTLFPTPVP